MLKLCVICHTIGKPFDITLSVFSTLDAPCLSGYVDAMVKNMCPRCENKNTMIPLDTPRAQKIIREYNIEMIEFIRDEFEKKYPWDQDKLKK